MSLIEFTQEKLVDGVNTANNLTLTLADVVFSKPKDNTSGVYNGETLIRMKARSTGQIDGTSVFGYDRVPLSVLHIAIVGALPVPVTVTDPYDALPYFHYHYGIGIPEYQLLAEWVTGPSDDKQLKLTALTDNPYFKGTATFALIDSEVNPDPYLYDPTTNIVDSGKEYAELYKFPLNLSSYATTMQAITESTVDFKALTQALRTVTGHDWKYDIAAPYSLLGAIVRMVGLSQASWGASTSYTYAVVIELSNNCLALEGNLILHFN